MIKYKTSTSCFDGHVTAVEIDKETEKCVFINGNRSAKFSEWSQYHDTFEQAKEYALNNAKIKLRNAIIRKEEAEKDIAEIEALTDK